MIPLIGLLLCVYLVFKGIEIYSILWAAYNSSRRDSNGEPAPSSAIWLGAFVLIAAIGMASIFALMFLAAGMPASMSNPPEKILPLK